MYRALSASTIPPRAQSISGSIRSASAEMLECFLVIAAMQERPALIGVRGASSQGRWPKPIPAFARPRPCGQAELRPWRAGWYTESARGRGLTRGRRLPGPHPTVAVPVRCSPAGHDSWHRPGLAESLHSPRSPLLSAGLAGSRQARARNDKTPCPGQGGSHSSASCKRFSSGRFCVQTDEQRSRARARSRATRRAPGGTRDRRDRSGSG